jgi:hypothetical protein
MAAVIKSINDGQMSVRDAERSHNIPRMTIRGRMTGSRSRRDAHAHEMLMTEQQEEDLVGIGWLLKLLLPCHQDQSSRLNNTSYIKPLNPSIRSYKRRRAYARFHRRQVIISLTQRISQKHNVRRNKGTKLHYHFAISSVVV